MGCITVFNILNSVDDQLRLKLVCDAWMTMQVHSNYGYCYERSGQHVRAEVDELSAAPIRWMAPESIEEGVFSSQSNVVSMKVPRILKQFQLKILTLQFRLF